MKKKPKKPFDCVEMKRQGAALVAEMLKGKSQEEIMEFWKEQSKALSKLMSESRKRPRRSA